MDQHRRFRGFYKTFEYQQDIPSQGWQKSIPIESQSYVNQISCDTSCTKGQAKLDVFGCQIEEISKLPAMVPIDILIQMVHKFPRERMGSPSSPINRSVKTTAYVLSSCNGTTGLSNNVLLERS